jgi:hypothetical protein
MELPLPLMRPVLMPSTGDEYIAAKKKELARES